MRKRRKSRRRTYKKKTAARRAAREGQPVYHVRGGWRIGKRRKKRKRR